MGAVRRRWQHAPNVIKANLGPSVCISAKSATKVSQWNQRKDQPDSTRHHMKSNGMYMSILNVIVMTRTKWRRDANWTKKKKSHFHRLSRCCWVAFGVSGYDLYVWKFFSKWLRLPVKVKATEARSTVGANAKILFKQKVNLLSDSGTSVPWPWHGQFSFGEVFSIRFGFMIYQKLSASNHFRNWISQR